jgi:hypothetical protein
MRPCQTFTIVMVDDARLPDLFTPLTIGSLRLHNRFAMAPMTRAADPKWVDHLRDDQLGEFGGFDAATALSRLY